MITKTSINAFTTTNLQQLLTTRGIGELVVCGIQTEQCCETTTRVAADLGYDVTFVTEATATFPIPHRDAPRDRPYDEVLADPRTLGTAAIVERTEYALAGRFATIRTIDEVATGRGGGRRGIVAACQPSCSCWCLACTCSTWPARRRCSRPRPTSACRTGSRTSPSTTRCRVRRAFRSGPARRGPR